MICYSCLYFFNLPLGPCWWAGSRYSGKLCCSWFCTNTLCCIHYRKRCYGKIFSMTGLGYTVHIKYLLFNCCSWVFSLTKFELTLSCRGRQLRIKLHLTGLVPLETWLLLRHFWHLMTLLSLQEKLWWWLEGCPLDSNALFSLCYVSLFSFNWNIV